MQLKSERPKGRSPESAGATCTFGVNAYHRFSKPCSHRNCAAAKIQVTDPTGGSGGSQACESQRQSDDAGCSTIRLFGALSAGSSTLARWSLDDCSESDRMADNMPTAIRIALVAIALFSLSCLAGCGTKRTAYGVSVSNVSWTTSTTNPVDGVDRAFVTLVALKAGPPDGLKFVVWSDLPGAVLSGQGEGSVGGAFYEGHLRANDGRRVDFLAKTTDGKSGTIKIAGVDHDFSKGTLFLISTHQDAPTVAQIKTDLSELLDGKSSARSVLTQVLKEDAVKELVKSNPQVRDFFVKHGKADENSK